MTDEGILYGDGSGHPHGIFHQRSVAPGQPTPSRQQLRRARRLLAKAARRRGIPLDTAPIYAGQETTAMMPKVTLKAPAGVGGQIHASQSGRNYTIADDGTVTVDSSDVRDLIGAGFQPVSHDGDPNTETAVPISSPSVTADTQGATALDPAARGALQREAPTEAPQQSEDYGGATPPHGRPLDLGNDQALIDHKQADADEVARTAASSDAPLAGASPEANTGNASQPAATGEQQEKALENQGLAKPAEATDLRKDERPAEPDHAA